MSKNPLIKTLMPNINLKCLIETDECGINRFLPSFNTSEIASTSALYYYTLKASFSVLSSGKYCPVQDWKCQPTTKNSHLFSQANHPTAAVCSWRQTECIMWHNAGKRPRVSWLWCLHHAASPVPGTVFTLLTRRDIRTWPSLHTAATQNLYTDWLTNVHYDLLGLLSQPKIKKTSPSLTGPYQAFLAINVKMLRY